MLHSHKVKHGTGRTERLEEHAVETEKQIKSLAVLGAVLAVSNLVCWIVLILNL